MRCLRFSRRDGDEAFELKRLAEAGGDWFYQDGTRFTYGTFRDNVGFVSEMNAEFVGKSASGPARRWSGPGRPRHRWRVRDDNLRVNGHVERGSTRSSARRPSY
jgi:hypothetical protein